MCIRHESVTLFYVFHENANNTKETSFAIILSGYIVFDGGILAYLRK